MMNTVWQNFNQDFENDSGLCNIYPKTALRTAKHLRLQTAQDNQQMINSDVSWFYCYDPETKQQYSQWIYQKQQDFWLLVT